MAVVLLVLFLVAIVVIGGLGREYLKTSKEHNRLFRKDMNKLKERIDQLETDMTKLKELVADTIIDNA